MDLDNVQIVLLWIGIVASAVCAFSLIMLALGF
jgi:hypothetical protein